MKPGGPGQQTVQVQMCLGPASQPLDLTLIHKVVLCRHKAQVPGGDLQTFLPGQASEQGDPGHRFHSLLEHSGMGLTSDPVEHDTGQGKLRIKPGEPEGHRGR